MGLFRKKKEVWQRDYLPFDERMENMKRDLEDLIGVDIHVLDKRPDENTFDYATEIAGYKTKPDERVILGHEKQADMWGWEKCPHCGLYGSGSVQTCLCGYKFKNF